LKDLSNRIEEVKPSKKRKNENENGNEKKK